MYSASWFEILREKNQRKTPIFNVRMHTCNVSETKILKLNFETLQHPSYLQWRFAVLYLEKNSWWTMLWRGKKIQKRLDKCIELKGYYVEKFKKIGVKTCFYIFSKDLLNYPCILFLFGIGFENKGCEERNRKIIANI